MTREDLLKQAKPILFNTEMVRAILEGRKTVTRRAIKPKSKKACGISINTRRTDGVVVGVYECDEGGRDFDNALKPPCKKGDILYVRETWTEEYKKFYYRADYDSDYLEPCETLSGGYPADCRYYPGCVGCTRGRQRIMWHPSIHMPKEATRIFLKVTDVRVERLQDMSEDDAFAEGVSPWDDRCYARNGWKPTFYDPDSGGNCQPLHAFEDIWNSTIKKADLNMYGWEANPWVWVVEFERFEV